MGKRTKEWLPIAIVVALTYAVLDGIEWAFGTDVAMASITAFTFGYVIGLAHRDPSATDTTGGG